MGRMVIAAYRPRPGQEEALLQLTREHLPILRSIGLATDRPALAMRAKDGTVIEAFEWVSDEAIEKAHTHPVVLDMWGRYEAACEYVRLSSVAETADQWAMFEPIDDF